MKVKNSLDEILYEHIVESLINGCLLYTSNTNRVLLHLLRRQGEKEIVPFFAITPELLPFQPKEQENQAQAAPQAQKPFSCDYGQQNHQLQNTPPWNQ